MMENETSFAFTYYCVKYDISLKTIGCSKFRSYFISSFIYAIIKSEGIVSNELVPLTKEEFQKCN